MAHPVKDRISKAKEGFFSSPKKKDKEADLEYQLQLQEKQAKLKLLSNEILSQKQKLQNLMKMQEETDFVVWFKGLGLNNSGQAWEQLHTSSACLAASLGDTQSLELMFKQGIDILRKNYDGCTALELAISNGHLECVKYLINNGASLTTDRFGQTPLAQALNGKHYDIAAELESFIFQQQKLSLDNVFSDSEPIFQPEPELDYPQPPILLINKTVPRSNQKKREKKAKKVTSKGKDQPDYVIVHGIKRGMCLVPNCDCLLFSHKETGKYSYCNCDHFLASHQYLGKVAASSKSLSYADQHSFTELWSSEENVNSYLVPCRSQQLTTWPRKLNLEVTPYKNQNVNFQRNVETEYNCLIEATEVEFQAQIGVGSFSEVFKGRWSNRVVAIKLMLFDDSSLEYERIIRDFQSELDIISKVNHPNCLGFHGIVVRPRICFVLEYCSKGSMYDVLTQDAFELDWPRLFRWYLDALKGISYLHNFTPCILHRDIKSKNLLLDESDVVKIADFGSSRYSVRGTELTLSKMRGTYCYTAPEIYFGNSYTVESDVYSLGILLWELVRKCVTKQYLAPFSEYPFIVHDFQIIILSAKKNIRPTIPPECPPQIKAFIELIWSSVPRQRPTIPKILHFFEVLSERLKKRGLEEGSSGTTEFRRDLLSSSSVHMSLEVPSPNITSSDTGTGSSGPASRREVLSAVAKSSSKSSQSPNSTTSQTLAVPQATQQAVQQQLTPQPRASSPTEMPRIPNSNAPPVNARPSAHLLESSDSAVAIRYVTKSTRRRADDNAIAPANTLKAMLMRRSDDEKVASPRGPTGNASTTPSSPDFDALIEHPSTSISMGGHTH